MDNVVGQMMVLVHFRDKVRGADIEETAGGKKVRVGVLNALAREEAEQIGNQINELINPVELFHSRLSPAIGTHVGPGTVGFAYYVEE